MPVSQYKFGEFDLDSANFELRRRGRTQKLERVPLERIPMELLILLAERQGSVVTRQEIVDRLWGKDVFVDTDHGINTAIRKVRQALRDDPDHPRFVHTVSGKGYRFVTEKNGRLEAAELDEGRTPRTPSGPDSSGRKLTASETSAPRRALTSRVPTRKTVIAIAALSLLAATVLVVLRPRLFPSAPATQIHSLAVLPLVNLSGDDSQGYFADGMTDELITALAKNRNLRVVSRTSVMQYKGVNRPVREIASELGVDGILEGSVERSANRVHMTVQLIYAPTDTHLWAQSYNRDETQALSLPEELSQIVAREVKITTSAAPRPRYISPEAHDAYLHGRYFWFTFDAAQTLPYFEKAIQLQPDYAAAWAGLADTYAVQALLGNAPPRESLAKAGDAARKAVELDDSLAESHLSMASWYLWSWDPLHADAEIRRAIELNPDYAESHYLRHYILLALNRPAEALQEEKLAVELDPFARSWGLGYCYIQLRQFDAAISEFRMQSVARPDDAPVHQGLVLAYRLKGMAKESEQELEKQFELEHNAEGEAAARRAYAKGGEKAVAQWQATVTRTRSREEYVSPWDIAQNVANTRDKDETLQYLEASYREHAPALISIQAEPIFDFLHDDPRYRALVTKLKLTPAY
jgi:TolB-like protein/DNA-binding winged helix-turn-helix (wHTH) protein/Tfp pilus assembly protein PilF